MYKTLDGKYRMTTTKGREAMEIKPQKLKRTVLSYNDETGRREPRTLMVGTGWWEATTDEGLTALAQTPEGARSMIERMRRARAEKA